LSHAATIPEKPALALSDRSVTYGKLAQAILSAEHKIREAGLKHGDLVAISIGSPIRHLTLMLALHRAGIASVSLRKGLEIRRAGLTPTATLEDEEFAVLPGHAHLRVDESWFNAPAPTNLANYAAGFAGPDDLCRVMLSSGTTGYPKAIGFTVKDVESRLVTYGVRAGGAAWDRMLCLPGLSTNFGYSFALMALAAGKAVCFASSAREALQLIARIGVDCMVASTQQLKDMVEQQLQSPLALPTLRVVHVGGNVMSAPFLAAARLQICARIICAYGSTEAGAVAHAPSEMLADITGAVGIVSPWVEVQALDERGNVLPRGEIGILRMRAEGQGHTYGSLSSDIDNFSGGWFYPGDRGTVLENGMLVILGRTGDLINAGGAKIAPELVEEVMLGVSGVKDAAALAAIGSTGIEELWVAIVAEGTIDENEIIAHCARKNPDLKPSRLVVVAAIPRSATGKVQRGQLRQQLKL
jgi:acyl-CoA synthetase (AMP-forming)/AMP-acid ligase II